MKQPLSQKIKQFFMPLLRKLTGHIYDCCGGYKRCSRCKYVIEEDGT